MGTRRRVRHHRKRYRGGEPFIPDLTATGPAAKERERKRYEAWLAKRKVEAEDDAKGHEENAKMAAFNERQKQQRAKELEDLRKLEEGRRKSVSDSCKDVLETNGITGNTPAERRKAYMQFALKNHPDKGGDTELFQKVDGCYRKQLEGAGRTRRRGSRRRKHTRRRR